MWPFSRREAQAPRAEPQLFEKIAALPMEQKASAVGAIISALTLKLPQWPKRNFEQSAVEAYQRNPVANACVYLTARAAANIPLCLMRDESEIDIPELRALLNRPNPAMDGEAFRIATISDLMLAGEFFAERVDLGKKPKELYRWSPGRTAVNPGEEGMTAAYTFKIGGQERTIKVDLAKGIVPVLHVREYHPTDDWRGMPNVDPAAFSIDMHTGALRWNNALLNNSAQPSGALVYAPKEGSDKLDDTQWLRLKAEIEETFSGAKNAGRPMLLDGGLDWKGMGLSPKEMDFGESLNASARLIALSFGVPPLILGIPGDNTFANYTEANKAFYRQTVLPLLGQWCRAMSWWVGPAFGEDIQIVPDTDDIEVFADERAAQWDRVEKSTCMTVNEKREKMGLPPVNGGDVVLVPSSMIPLDVAGETPEGGPEPAPDEDDGEGDIGGAADE